MYAYKYIHIHIYYAYILLPRKEVIHFCFPPRTAFSSKGNAFDPFRKLRTVRRGGRGALLTEKLRGRSLAPVDRRSGPRGDRSYPPEV